MSDVPENANVGCPGTESQFAGRTSSCSGCPNQKACNTGEKVVDPDIELINHRLRSIKYKILVLSGKGGVGKSTVTANLACTLIDLKDNDERINKIGVLDVDICGPSQARIFGCEDDNVHEGSEGWDPIVVKNNLLLMSIAFLLDSRNDAVIWRGPRKNALIKQFLRDVNWGSIDYLLIDTPPGTSDEHISIVQLLVQSSCISGAIIVTTPQEISLLDVRKEISFCHKTKVRILGVVENMHSFVCPSCSHSTELFPSTTGGASAMCKELGVELLTQIPHDPALAKCADEGQDYIEKFRTSVVGKKFSQLALTIIKKCKEIGSF